MSDTPTGETVNVDSPKNDATTPSTPPVATTGITIDAERLKVLEQQEMRANQLANQLKSREEAEAAAKEKELEEQNKFKDLFEQEKAKREALEQEQQTKERQAELETAKADALTGFSDEVKKAADKLGLTLLDTDEVSVEAFKEKLSVLAPSVSAENTVTPNNPSPSNPSALELTQDQIREVVQDDNAFHKLMVKKFPGIASMTKTGK